MLNTMDTCVDSTSINLLGTFMDSNVIHLVQTVKTLLECLGTPSIEEMEQDEATTNVELNIISHIELSYISSFILCFWYVLSLCVFF
jgi:hypothetical protein